MPDPEPIPPVHRPHCNVYCLPNGAHWLTSGQPHEHSAETRSQCEMCRKADEMIEQAKR